MIEQRKNKRFAMRLSLEIVQVGELTGIHGETINMSSTGVLFRANAELPLGESIEYLVSLPEHIGEDVEVQLRCLGKLLRTGEEGTYAATLDRYEFVRVPLTVVLERKAAAASQAWT